MGWYVWGWNLAWPDFKSAILPTTLTYLHAVKVCLGSPQSVQGFSSSDNYTWIRLA